MSDLTRLVEWKVAENEIDHIGHMNMHFYAVRAREGAERILDLLGRSQGEFRSAGLMTAIIEQHTTYRREQLAGSALSMAGGVCAAEAKALTTYEEMSNDATGDMAATFFSTLQVQDRATRCARDIPDALLRAARTQLISPPGRYMPRSLPPGCINLDVTLDDLAGAGVEAHGRHEIEAGACDEDGFLAPRQVFRPPASIPKGQGVMDNVWGILPGFTWPALEGRNVTLATPRVGDVLVSYTAVLEVSHKVMQWCSWTFDAERKHMVSAKQQVNVFFDMSARRPHDIPQNVRGTLTDLAHSEFLLKVR